MNDEVKGSTILEAQVGALLDLVEQHRSEHCEAIRAAAGEECRRLLAAAHREARTRMHEAIEEERRRHRQQTDATRAQLQTRDRQRRHQAEKILLHRGWDRLADALQLRWEEAPSRRSWIAALTEQALAMLPHSPWTIEHPGGWDSAELGPLAERVTEHCGVPPRFETGHALTAGLRLHADGTCLDGSLRGLLADRTGVEAQMLAELRRLGLGEK